MTSPAIGSPLFRSSRFNYLCCRCSRCCHHKRIQLNPYEVARLARNLGCTTGEFIRRYVEVDVSHLRVNDQGACIFLTPGGCSVHKDRPLVCRLYPLGRHINSEGREYFILDDPHPASIGIYGDEFTVADYLSDQRVKCFISAADKYLHLFYRLWKALQQYREIGPATTARSFRLVRLRWMQQPEQRLADWLDMDRSVNSYCEKHGILAPENISERTLLHIRSVDEWLDESSSEIAL